MRLLIAVLLLSGAGLPHARTQAGAIGAVNTPCSTGVTDTASCSRAMDARLEHARETLGRLLAVPTARTIDYPDSLAVFSFARNEDLWKRMRRAAEFGKALGVRQQMIYAKLSLSVSDREPKEVDTTAMVNELTTRYRPFPVVDGTHFQTSFGHLDGYFAVYYTYGWSLVIAKDLFSQFDGANLLSTAVAGKHREHILALGGSKPAVAMVENVLGCPCDFSAWGPWLNRDEPSCRASS